jgi:hypothetical protein
VLSRCPHRPNITAATISSNAQNENCGMISVIISSESQDKSNEKACICCVIAREAKKGFITERSRDVDILPAGVHVALRKGAHNSEFCVWLVRWRIGFENVVGLCLKDPYCVHIEMRVGSVRGMEDRRLLC